MFAETGVLGPRNPFLAYLFLGTATASLIFAIVALLIQTRLKFLIGKQAT